MRASRRISRSTGSGKRGTASPSRATCAAARASFAQTQSQALAPASSFRLEEAAAFPHQVTGVACSADGRIFVNFPRWTEDAPVSVAEVAASILEMGQREPILVRADGERFVLIEGVHRLEACKALGEKTIVGYMVDARKH